MPTLGVTTVNMPNVGIPIVSVPFNDHSHHHRCLVAGSQNSQKSARYYRVAKIHSIPEVAGHFGKRATNYRALLRKMTYKEKGIQGVLATLY